jgi:tungstate transport system ATP-binding protein
VAKAVLTVEDLIVRYGSADVVHVPGLEIREREILAMMGPNGAGKSTLLRVLGLLERPTRGTVVFQGRAVEYRSRELLALHRQIAVVFQEPLLIDGTVIDNVSLGLRLRGLDDLEGRVDPWLERFGIAHLRDRRVKTLSGGEAQRTSLARAFVLDPRLLLLDEPLSALDPPTRDALLADLKTILSETRTTTVFVTHDRDEAIALGDRVAVMMQGRILQLDAPERTFSFPIDEEVARFVGVETVLPGRAHSVNEGLVTIEIDGREVEVVGEALPGERVLVCIRPEDIVLSRADMGPSSMRNHLEARVERTIPLGRFVRVVLNGQAPIVASITWQSHQEMDLKKGDRVLASFKATAAHIIRRPEPRNSP